MKEMTVPIRNEVRDISDKVTVFVSTIGDERNLTDCLKHLEQQTVMFTLQIIDRIAPLSAAFQAMLDNCKTAYYVQVDEDMLLYPRAIEALFESIVQSADNVAMVCGGLWDCDVEHPIIGVKIYRHAIVRQFPYENTFSCEKAQLTKIRMAGYGVLFLRAETPDACLGEHGKHYTPKTIFARWRRLMHKQRRYRTLPWVVRWPPLLLERYLKTRERLHLYAFLGAVTGIVGDLPPDCESDFRKPCPDFARLTKYFPTDDDALDLNTSGVSEEE